MAQPPHVALLVESSHGYGRALLTGIIQYVHEHGPWSLYLRPQGLEAAPPRWLTGWHGDGILVRVENRAMAEAVAQSELPAVNLRLPIAGVSLPVVGLDNLALGELAFRHLADCGLQHFAFCGTIRGQYPWLEERLDSFVEAVQVAGRQCHAYFAPKRRKQPTWEEEEDLMSDWVGGLPKPVGIMACNDDRGLDLLEACRRAGALVPEEVAVIGVDNDEFICQLSNPPMSSISANAQHIGYEAAALLTRLMKGESPPGEPILLQPGGVVPRVSTDVLATDDRELARAIRHIRQHACEGLRVNELTRVSNLSYKTLKHRMRELLGRSPKEEITRIQIEQAKRLLLQTDLTAAAIARRCGFDQPKYFSQVFREKSGLPPAAYRRSNREPPRSPAASPDR